MSDQHNGVNGVYDSRNQDSAVEDQGGVDGTIENAATSHQSPMSNDTETDGSPEEIIGKYDEFNGMPPGDVLVVTAFRWMCEYCHDLRRQREVARKQRIFQVKLREIESDNRIPAEEKPKAKWAVHKQHQFDIEHVTKKRSEELQLIQKAIEWTVDYAREVYHYVLYCGHDHNEAARQAQESL